MKVKASLPCLLALGTFFLVACNCPNKKSSAASGHSETRAHCPLDDPDNLNSLQVFDLKKHPESIYILGDRIFVSCVGDELKPTDKDGDGALYEINRKGIVVQENAFPEVKLDAPKGMAALGNILYVTDIDRVVGIDTTTGKQVANIDLSAEKMSFLNDLVANKDGKLYASSTDTNQILLIDPVEKSYTVLQTTPTITGPNGITLNPEQTILYVAGYAKTPEGAPSGQLWALDLKNQEATCLNDIKGEFDGIALLGESLLFSDWQKNGHPGAIRALNLETKAISDLSKIDLQGTADFFIDKKTHSIWVPSMMNKKLYHAPINCPEVPPVKEEK